MYESVGYMDLSPVLNPFSTALHLVCMCLQRPEPLILPPFSSEHISPSNHSSCQKMIKLLTELFVKFSDKSVFSYFTLSLQKKEETIVQLLTVLIVVTDTDYFKKKLIGVCPH